MATDSRSSMVRSAASLIRSRGVNATSFSDVLAESGAPRGSIYHHFPEGKRQLTEEAVRLTADQVLGAVRSGPTGSPSDVLSHFIGLWRQVVVASGGTAGCAVAGVAVDTVDDPDLMEVVRDTFRSWVKALAEQLATAGVSPGRAASIAQLALAGMEGALILSRAEGDSGPLDTVADELMRLLDESAVQES
jgi:AcrR family transcriptional regulator